MNKILITGGAGFIGYNIAKILAENGDNDIHIIDDLSKGKKDDEFCDLIEKNNVNFFQLDLTNLNTYEKIDDEYHQIYHLAAIVGVRNVMENPVLTVRVNSLSTIYLLDHIKKMEKDPKILFASSCENYAGSTKHCNVKIPTPEDIILCIEDVYNPRWTYASTKILGEIACLHYSKEYDFNTTVVRYHNIYGPRMGTQHVIPEFIIRLKKDPNNFEMYGGDQYRCFCYATDAAKMTINLMNNKDANAKIVNIGNNNNIRISSIAKKLCKIMKINPKITEKGAPKGSPQKRIPDISLIKKLKCFESTVDFEKGLKLTMDWYMKNM